MRVRLLPFMVLAGCAHGPALQLTITSPVPGARIYVDDRLVGTTTQPLLVALDQGVHRVELRADGYYSAYRTVWTHSAHDPPLTLNPPLRPVPEGAHPF